MRRKRLLVLDAKVPTPDRESGSLRLVRILDGFRRLGFEITLVPSFPASFPPFDATLAADEAALRARGVEIPALAERDPADAYLERAAASFDLALVSGIFVAARHLDPLRRAAPGLPIVFDTIDLHFLREYRHARLTGNVPRLEHARKLKRLETSAAQTVAATLVVSENEAELLRREAPRARVHVVPLAVDPVPDRPPFAARRDLLYLGGFTFAPNADAVAWFVREVMPLLRSARPGLALSVVGSDVTEEVRALAAPDVRIVGHVPDLQPVFAAHRVFVAPLRWGAGVKGKVQLSLAHGLPAVLSPIAAEGIPLVDGRDAMLARDPASWAERISALDRDPALWAALAERGPRLVGERYSSAALDGALARLVAALDESPS